MIEDVLSSLSIICNMNMRQNTEMAESSVSSVKHLLHISLPILSHLYTARAHTAAQVQSADGVHGNILKKVFYKSGISSNY